MLSFINTKASMILEAVTGKELKFSPKQVPLKNYYFKIQADQYYETTENMF